MFPMRTTADGFRSRIAGVLAGLTAASPALAASFEATLPPRELLLFALLVLLAVALALRLMQRRESSGHAPDGPDLRWWKNYDA